MMHWDAVKVFSATKAADRNQLGDRVTNWISQIAPNIINVEVRQSSDSDFHCLTIVIFYEKE